MPSKRREIFTRLYDITCKETAILIVAAVPTENLAQEFVIYFASSSICVIYLNRLNPLGFTCHIASTMSSVYSFISFLSQYIKVYISVPVMYLISSAVADFVCCFHCLVLNPIQKYRKSYDIINSYLSGFMVSYGLKVW